MCKHSRDARCVQWRHDAPWMHSFLKAALHISPPSRRRHYHHDCARVASTTRSRCKWSNLFPPPPPPPLLVGCHHPLAERGRLQVRLSLLNVRDGRWHLSSDKFHSQNHPHTKSPSHSDESLKFAGVVDDSRISGHDASSSISLCHLKKKKKKKKKQWRCLVRWLVRRHRQHRGCCSRGRCAARCPSFLLSL